MKNTLFTLYNMNGIPLKNHFLMTPMTRSRASQPEVSLMHLWQNITDKERLQEL